MQLQAAPYICSVLLFASFIFGSSAQNQQAYLDQATHASQTLIDNYYDNDSGLFSGLWWNSAVMLTFLTSLQNQAPNSTNPDVPTLLQNTFEKKKLDGFINAFYDDEGWWALNWITAYDLTGNQEYLSTAAGIWKDMQGGWRDENCGGIWWNKQHASENAIANVLFLSVSAHLADRDTQNKAMYLDWAQKEWQWFSTSGMLDTSADGGIVHGGYDPETCQVKGDGGWTYTQGMAIQALLALNKVAPAPELVANATAIADATITYPRFTDKNGIFTEPIGPTFDANTAQWKGIFLNNLMLLQKQAPKQAYVDFATKNAGSILSAAKFANGTLSPSWDAKDAPSAPSQSSAMAALIAAGGMQVKAAS